MFPEETLTLWESNSVCRKGSATRSQEGGFLFSEGMLWRTAGELTRGMEQRRVMIKAEYTHRKSPGTSGMDGPSAPTWDLLLVSECMSRRANGMLTNTPFLQTEDPFKDYFSWNPHESPHKMSG